MGDRVSDDIAARTFQFALRIVKLVRALDQTGAGHVLGSELLRSRTSISC